MKSALREAQEALAQWRGSLVIQPPNPDAPPPPEPPAAAKRMSEAQRAEQNIRRAKWRIAASRLSPAARERKRFRDRERMRRNIRAEKGVLLAGKALLDRRMKNLEKANEAKRLLRMGITPQPRIFSERRKPYSRRWCLNIPKPQGVRNVKGMPTAASPFLARLQAEAEARARAACLRL